MQDSWVWAAHQGTSCSLSCCLWPLWFSQCTYYCWSSNFCDLNLKFKLILCSVFSLRWLGWFLFMESLVLFIWIPDVAVSCYIILLMFWWLEHLLFFWWETLFSCKGSSIFSSARIVNYLHIGSGGVVSL